MYNDLIDLFLQSNTGEQVVDSLPVAIYATDTEGRLKYYNSAAVKFSGQEPELGIDKWCVNLKLYHTDGSPMSHAECPMAVALEEERSIHGAEAIAERPDGKRVWFKAYSSPLYNEEGNVIGGLSVLVDITDQKETEKQLRDTKEELADFFDNAAVGLNMTDPDGIIKRANQAMLDMLGYSREEFVGRHISDFHADQDIFEDMLKKISAGEELRDYEVSLKAKDGSIRHARLSSNGYWEGGEFVHTRCITRDITPRKQARAELQNVTAKSERQERLYEAIISSTPDLVYVFDLNYRSLFANDALLEMWGLTREESIGKRLEEIGYEPWHAEMHEREIDQVIATKQPVQGEVSFPHAKLGWRFYDYIFVPALDGNGEVEAVAGTTRDVTDRKQAEQALRESEEKYRTLFETMDEGFCIIKMKFDDNNNPTGFRYLETNPAFEKHVSLKSAEQKNGNKVLPDIGEEWIKKYGNVVLTGEPAHGEVYAEDLNRWLDISAFRAGEPEEQKVAVLFKDITERKKAQQNLRKHRDRLRAALGINTVGVIFWDAKSVTIKEVNDAFLDMSGFTRKEAVGKSWRELTPEEFHPISEKAVADLKKSDHTEPYEKQYIRKDGSRWWGLFAPRRIDENELVEFVLDITERKHVQEEREQLLRQVEAEREQLSNIFKRAPSFMCILRGPDHVFERANDYYRQLMGDREIIGKPAREAMPEIEEQGLIGLLDEVYDTGVPFRGTDMEIMLRRQPDTDQPEKRFLDFVYQPLRDPGGSINGIFVQGVDLTERHHAKEQLKAINETLEERVEERTKELLSYQAQLRSLASQLSKAEENQRQQLAAELHDNLGQLLALGKMKVDLLQNDSISIDSSRAITDLQEVLDDALRYTRELMSELKPPPSIDGDIKAAIEWVAEKVDKRGLKVTIDDDRQPIALDEDARITVLQSVRELLFNVMKHTSEEEAVVCLRSNEDQLRITVKDEGEGFDLENTEWAPDKNGSFGLFNVQERIDLLGGRVDIESKLGKGTKVTLYIPLFEEAKAEGAVKQVREVGQTNESKPSEIEHEERIKVLLVDDHTMVRKGLRKIIEDQDDVIVAGEAGDGMEAVALSRETSPDIILMDVNMPKMDGIEATRRIISEMPDVRIIGLSLHDEKRVIENMRSAGASAYLTKTEAFESLIVTIRAEASARKE